MIVSPFSIKKPIYEKIIKIEAEVSILIIKRCEPITSLFDGLRLPTVSDVIAVHTYTGRTTIHPC